MAIPTCKSVVTETQAIDVLVAKNTAFRRYSELAFSMDNGYVPSLRSDRKGPKALGLALEALGRKVFWLGGSFWGYS
jgi:hypothetical protein